MTLNLIFVVSPGYKNQKSIRQYNVLSELIKMADAWQTQRILLTRLFHKYLTVILNFTISIHCIVNKY